MCVSAVPRFDDFVFRIATEADLVPVCEILRLAVTKMLAEGKCQWDESYPNAAHVRDDMGKGIGYVMELNGEVVAYGAVTFDGEPAYDELEGCWLSRGEYVVLHRLAVRRDLGGRGIGTRVLTAVGNLALARGVTSFKVDTNFDNTAMLGLLRKLGFTYCGEVRYGRGTRMAFEKLLENL